MVHPLPLDTGSKSYQMFGGCYHLQSKCLRYWNMTGKFCNIVVFNTAKPKWESNDLSTVTVLIMSKCCTIRGRLMEQPRMHDCDVYVFFGSVKYYMYDEYAQFFFETLVWYLVHMYAQCEKSAIPRSWIARDFFLQLQNEEITVWEKFLSEFQKVFFK